MSLNRFRLLLACSGLLCLLLPLAALAAPVKAPAGNPTVKLAANGKALLPVVVSPTASDAVKAMAQTLAEYLKRISGASFNITTGDGTTGLAVGTSADFPKVQSGIAYDAKDPFTRERYLLRSHAKGLYLIGATPLAVQHAVWDCLRRLGYRQFFPSPTWEVVPSWTAPTLSVNIVSSPSYYSRRIWYGFGSYPENMTQYADWCAKNRALSSIALNTGHAYDGIIHRNEAEFKAHPEYLALRKDPKTGVTARGGSKFCISNPGLRQLVVAHCLKSFAENPELDSASLDPSDGGGWCECEPCVAIGSVSDRVVTLANEAARAVNEKYPGKFIGIYAYNQHSPPPTKVKVDPHVIVSVATAFITGGFTVDQLLEGWRKAGATEGIREYYSVNTWDRNLPGAARGSNLDYLQTTIPHFYEQGARFMSSESGDCWGLNGLGYYFASRVLWDVKEAQNRVAILDDFFRRAFGPAEKPMRLFYRRIEGSKRQLMSEDLVGRLYRDLRAARALTTDAKILARINDLILYVRYVELFQEYSNTTGAERLKALEEMCRFVYRIRTTGMVHSYAIYRDVPARDNSITVPENCTWNTPEAKNPWKQNPPVTSEEIDGYLTAGIERNKLLDFTPVSFSEDLVPAGRLKLPQAPVSMENFTSRYDLHLHTWVPEGQGKIELQFSGIGRIFTVHSPKDAVGDGVSRVDKRGVTLEKPEQLTLTTPFDGPHLVQTSGSSTPSVTVRLLGDLPMTVPCGDTMTGRWYLYFYVPKGTKVIGGYADSKTGSLLDPEGKEAFSFVKMNKIGYFSVPVPAGQDGKLWKMHFCAGKRLLMTVPPYYARNAAELLLPKEVVEKDAPR